MNKHGLTVKQKKFADNYIEHGNITQAAKEAGYSKPHVQGSYTLDNVRVRAYINDIMAEKDAKKIAKQDEILAYLTSVMRGEQKEEVLRGIGEGAQTIDDIDVNAKERLKAAELLLKRFPINKTEALREELIAVQIKKAEAEIERLSKDEDGEGAFEIIVKRKGVDE